MTPRVREIFARLNAINLAESELRAERVVLLAELQERREEGKHEEPEAPDFSMFKDTTRRLLTELWDAPRRMLSQQDIREDVMLDAYATDGAVREAMRKARRELRSQNFAYDIKNIKNKGYGLVVRETSPTSPNHKKRREIRTKKVRKRSDVR